MRPYRFAVCEGSVHLRPAKKIGRPVMEAAQPHHPPTHLAGEGEALVEARRQLALLQRRIEVEEALECVRAKAMAMHSSEDLASTVSAVFQELRTLLITPIRFSRGRQMR